MTTDSNYYADQLSRAVAASRPEVEREPGAPKPPALPREAAIAVSRAKALVRQGEFASAVTPAHQAVALAPQSAETRTLLGAIYLEIGDFAAAMSELAIAAQLAPQWAEVSRLCGEAAFRAGDLQTASSYLQYALSLQPNWPEAALRLGETMLKLGDYAEGFRLLEARFPAAGQPIPGPKWDGQAPLWDKTVLILAEREIGDLIQFARYADLLKKKGARVFVSCPDDLVSLLETVPGVHKAVPFSMGITPTDYVIPLLGLPLAFGTTLGTVPAVTPYMRAEESLLSVWKGYYSEQSPRARLRAGVIWADAGDPSPIPTRSLALADLAPLWKIPGIGWFALQQGPQHAELPCNETPLIDVSSDLTSPNQIVAAVGALDLLIAVDTPAVHVAGALNVPAWAPLAAACDWRWLGQGETTPWYPSVRCFRQEVPGEWEPVARRMANALAEVLAGA
jgi:tetratricopeptide (TPR) repeat protein